MLEKSATTSVPIDPLIAGRWSPRAFDSAARVTDAERTALLEAARWAPSCFNDQPWHFLVWDRHLDPDGFGRAVACLAESNRRWAASASILMLSIAADRFNHNGAPNRFAQYDTGAATLALVLQARSLGLAAHQMGGFDAQKARAEFGVPEGHAIMAMIALGRQDSPERLPDDLRERETGPRTRRPLEGMVHTGRW